MFLILPFDKKRSLTNQSIWGISLRHGCGGRLVLSKSGARLRSLVPSGETEYTYIVEPIRMVGTHVFALAASRYRARRVSARTVKSKIEREFSDIIFEEPEARPIGEVVRLLRYAHPYLYRLYYISTRRIVPADQAPQGVCIRRWAILGTIGVLLP